MGRPQAHIINKINDLRHRREERIQPAIPLPTYPPYPTPLELPRNPSDNDDITSAGTRILEIDL